MKDIIEKRTCRRCDYKGPVTCAFFNSDRFYHGRTMNHSDDGIYFESNFPVKPGASKMVPGIIQRSRFLLRNRSQILSAASITAVKFSRACLYLTELK